MMFWTLISRSCFLDDLLVRCVLGRTWFCFVTNFRFLGLSRSCWVWGLGGSWLKGEFFKDSTLSIFMPWDLRRRFDFGESCFLPNLFALLVCLCSF